MRNFNSIIDERASQIIPEWPRLPAADPMKSLAQLVAVCADRVDQKVDRLQQIVLEKLPGIFDIELTPAQAARGMTQFAVQRSLPDFLRLPRGIQLQSKDGLFFSTTHDCDIVADQGIDVETDRDCIWLGFDNCPPLFRPSLYLELRPAMTVPGLQCFLHTSQGLVPIGCEDRTHGGRQSGIITLDLPKKPAEKTCLYAKEKIWIYLQSDHQLGERLRRLEMNCAEIVNIQRFDHFNLGSGRNTPHQSFQCPEGYMTSIDKIQIFDPSRNSDDTWEYRSTLAASSAEDRHFMYYAKTNQICFGDGVNGMKAPAGFHNVWAHELHITQGNKANIPAGTSLQMSHQDWRVAAINLVTQTMGGSQPANQETLLSKTQTILQTRHRAISIVDYEQLALIASPRIGLAFASANDEGQIQVLALLGPQYSSIEEQLDFTPEPQDIEVLQSFLDQRRSLNSVVRVFAPEYRPIEVTAQVKALQRGKIDAEMLRLAIKKHFSPYQGVRPGSSFHREAILQSLKTEFKGLHIDDFRMIDQRTYVSCDVIHMKAFQLPKVSLAIKFTEVSL